MTSDLTVWSRPPESLRLNRDQVHFWRAFLKSPAANAADFYRLLSPDEIARAGKYKFQKDHDHFVMARATLRTILGGYLSVDPAHIVFCYNSHGKPALDEIPGKAVIYFNVSHSHEMALYAFTLGGQIGIDIEHIRPDITVEHLAERYFSREEAVMLQKIPEDARTKGFFDCWTCKEAYIKARGQGLSIPLESFSVLFTLDKPVIKLNTKNNTEESFQWTIRKLMPEPGYAAAAVFAGKDRLSSYWQITI